MSSSPVRFVARLAAALLLVACGGEADLDPPLEAAPVDPTPGQGEDAGGAGGGEGARDGAAPPGAPDAGIALGPPISVSPGDLEKWVWVPIEGTRCADGTEAGVGVNFTNQSRELVIFFQGNGVCYDALTCNLFKDLLVGMGDDPLDHMWWGSKTVGERGLFDRADAANPMRKSNFVVFPHCTIDAHTADKESSYTGVGVIQQRGYANVTKALARIVPTFTDATRIVIGGFSAGGIGATANYHQIATAFASVGKTSPPMLINDAGPVLRRPFLSKTADASVRKGWGLESTIDTFCPKCKTDGLGAIYETLALLHPGLRSSQLCSYGDTTVTNLYRLMNGDINVVDATKLKKGLLDHESAAAAWNATAAPSVHRAYYFPGDAHGAMVGAPLSSRPDLAAFLSDQLSGSAGWASVVP